MTTITEIRTPNAPAPLPVFSQAIKANGMVFCSGNIGLDKDTWKLVEGGIKVQTVCSLTSFIFFVINMNSNTENRIKHLKTSQQY